jgi:hypothetical protein
MEISRKQHGRLNKVFKSKYTWKEGSEKWKHIDAKRICRYLDFATKQSLNMYLHRIHQPFAETINGIVPDHRTMHLEEEAAQLQSHGCSSILQWRANRRPNKPSARRSTTKSRWRWTPLHTGQALISHTRSEVTGWALTARRHVKRGRHQLQPRRGLGCDLWRSSVEEDEQGIASDPSKRKQEANWHHLFIAMNDD